MSKKPMSEEYSFHEVFDTKENCDRIEILYEYFEGSLTKEKEERFEQHLCGCTVCASKLAEMNECESLLGRTILDAGKAEKIFRQKRLLIEEQLNKKYGSGNPVFPVVEKFRFPAYVNVMLVLFIGLLLYPAYRSFILERQVSQLQNEIAGWPPETAAPAPPEVESGAPASIPLPEPIVSPSVVFPIRSERDTEQKIIPIPFDQNETFTLLFSLPDDFERYVVEIDRQNQKIWRQGIQADRDEASQLTSVILQSGFFQEGEYQLKVSGLQEARTTQLSVYKLRIEK